MNRYSIALTALALLYGLLFGWPRTRWEWAQATLVAFVFLLPPALIGYRAAKRDRPAPPPPGLRKR